MRIAALSDLHGHLTHTVPQADVLVINGDIVPLWSSAGVWQSSRELEWLRTKFARWLRRNIEESGCRVAFVSAGNHDVVFQSPELRIEAIRAIADIHPRAIAKIPHALVDPIPTDVFEGVKFAFDPWTPTIQNRTWAFSLSRSSDGNPHLHIPVDTDVLVSHGPPLGLLDYTDDGPRGCSRLMHRMLEVGPAVTFVGHIHEERGRRERYFDLMGRQRKIINTCICDRNYSERNGKVQVYDLV